MSLGDFEVYLMKLRLVTDSRGTALFYQTFPKVLQDKSSNVRELFSQVREDIGSGRALEHVQSETLGQFRLFTTKE